MSDVKGKQGAGQKKTPGSPALFDEGVKHNPLYDDNTSQKSDDELKDAESEKEANTNEADRSMSDIPISNLISKRVKRSSPALIKCILQAFGSSKVFVFAVTHKLYIFKSLNSAKPYATIDLKACTFVKNSSTNVSIDEPLFSSRIKLLQGQSSSDFEKNVFVSLKALSTGPFKEPEMPSCIAGDNSEISNAMGKLIFSKNINFKYIWHQWLISSDMDQFVQKIYSNYLNLNIKAIKARDDQNQAQTEALAFEVFNFFEQCAVHKPLVIVMCSFAFSAGFEEFLFGKTTTEEPVAEEKKSSKASAAEKKIFKSQQKSECKNPTKFSEVLEKVSHVV